jgi:1,4-alpha-glucan branching enzyme
MSEKLMALTIRGRHEEWTFLISADPKYLEEWRADGLCIDEVVNVVPQTVADLGLTHIWCWLQDIGMLPIK